MILSILYIALGFFLLIKGADYLLEGACSIAKKLSIPEIVIGLTLVSFGTSAPELVVNLFASAGNHHGITFGNILGSNIFNTLVVLGVIGLMAPIMVKKRTLTRIIPFCFISGLATWLLAYFPRSNPGISRLEALVLIALMIGYLLYMRHMSRVETDENTLHTYAWPRTIIYITLGLVGLYVGGKLAIDHSVKLATILGLSEKFIGLTISALGTSLPEFITSVFAIIKKKDDIAVGNVVGSNIFNLLFVLGITGSIRPILFDPKLNIDFAFLMLSTVVLFAITYIWKQYKVYKLPAVFFLLLYAAYMTYLFIRG